MFQKHSLIGSAKGVLSRAAGALLIMALMPACSKEDDETPSRQNAQQQKGNLPLWAKPLNKEEEQQLEAGRWRRYRTHKFDEGLTQEQREALEQLEGIGYLSGSAEAKAASGVILHVPEEAYAGLNFYTSGHAQAAILIDMKGRVLHQWSHDFWKIWPRYPTPKSNRNTQFWRRAYLFENGDILVIYDGLGLVKLNKESGVIWSNPGKMHHDLHVMPNGDIYALSREAKIVPRINQTVPVLVDFISVLDAGGREKKRVSLLSCFENSIKYRNIWRGRRSSSSDLFHTNTLLVLDGRLEGRSQAFKKGNILISLREPDVIAVVDLGQQKIVWAIKGSFRKQHDPKILDNGNMLFFDNMGSPTESKVIEFDPFTNEVAWCFPGDAKTSFFSRTCGTADRLPNGNTLITESDMGRAIEVTPEKKIVWEFINPNRAGEKGEYIATLFEVIRLEPDFPISWARSQPQK